MKRIVPFLSLLLLLIFTSCLDNLSETTIKSDGSGTIVNTYEMGKILGLVKSMGGGGEELKAIENLKMDTIIEFKDIADSIADLSNAEKKLLTKATMHILANYDKEQFSFSFSAPFSKPSEIADINKVLKKSKGNVMEKQLSKVFPGGGDDMDAQMGKPGDGPDFDDVYNYSYASGKLTKKVDKGKYDELMKNEMFASLQQMSQMGMPINFKSVINLPNKAKKTSGKGLKVSDDGKKITIEGTLDDFLEDASYFDYEIEY